ncbi:hypothetical protein [Treponema brennaborense]|uniref:Uncharacterized protein n=1 Tax=Treponema brennaborense (strain DSM 12168 / CIP 105900 / DD5/3) TaxID=906968 RepID=F4LIT4_TREBD|nr:hypothetical protein [Treponema brennaborense]AEE16259.1 hypothetical protein Trebr_0823 [Treponema brennaborense DSM 12168]
MMQYPLFEQAIFSIIAERNGLRCISAVILPESALSEANLYLRAVAGKSDGDMPFTVHYPAANQAELIVRQTKILSLWTERPVFASECAPIIKKLEQTVSFLSELLDEDCVRAIPLEKHDIPVPPAGIGSVWRAFRDIPKSIMYDLCFFHQSSVMLLNADIGVRA